MSHEVVKIIGNTHFVSWRSLSPEEKAKAKEFVGTYVNRETVEEAVHIRVPRHFYLKTESLFNLLSVAVSCGEIIVEVMNDMKWERMYIIVDTSDHWSLSFVQGYF